MQLFTTKIDDIHAQIKALQVEAAKLQDLENATASSLANLKAVVANIKDDETTLATLKSAINSLFEPFNSSPKTVNERDNDFTYEFNSKDYAQRFVEMCKCRGDVDCQEYKLENTTVTVINHNEDDDLLMGLATDIENDAYSSDPPTEQTQNKATENDAEISNQIVCDDKAQAMKMYQHFKNNDLIIDCQISNDELAVEFSFMKTDSDSVGKLVYEFESSYTADEEEFESTVYGKINQYFNHETAQAICSELRSSDLIGVCGVQKEYHGHTVKYFYSEKNHEAVSDVVEGVLERWESQHKDSIEGEQDLPVIHERELRLPVMAVKVAQLVKEHYHKVEIKDSKFIGYNPHHFSEIQLDEIISEFNSRKPIQLSEQAQWDSQTDILYIWFKLKKTLKIWAEHYNVAHEDAIIRDQSDTSRVGYKYLLTVLRSANVDHTEWMTQQGKFDFSKNPQENRQQLIEDSKQQLYTEKYHILIQKNTESETVEIESSDEAYARKNYQHLVESIPDSYIHLMSDKRGCLETHKPPALSFMAAGMGWLNVIHNGEVLGMIYSDKTGWELETGEKFETREEAALAMLNSSLVAA